MAKMIIGVDEVGTGAWAGPFAIGAIAIPFSGDDLLIAAGVRDSKKLSEARRPAVLHNLSHHVHHAKVHLGSLGEMLHLGAKATWVLAVTRAVLRLHIDIERAGDKLALIRIDGSVDRKLIQRWESEYPQFLSITSFEPKSDDKYPVVGAASVMAKVARDEIMVSLHEQYPEYKWADNKGYGTQAHRDAIDEYGVTPYHRNIKNLKSAPKREDV